MQGAGCAVGWSRLTISRMRKAITHLRSSDPVLAAIIERVGPYRMQYRDPTFWAVARAIIFQQLNGKAASTIWDRLEKAAGGEVNPESILALTEKQMRAAGLSRQKLGYLRDLAARTASGEIDFVRMPSW